MFRLRRPQPTKAEGPIFEAAALGAGGADPADAGERPRGLLAAAGTGEADARLAAGRAGFCTVGQPFKY